VHGFHVALSDNRCDYRRPLNLHRGWSHNERHALERVLNALKNHATTELQFWSYYRRGTAIRKRSGATLYKVCVNERTAW
jgi:hypothetical protein